jgi:hypothetical protein
MNQLSRKRIEMKRIEYRNGLIRFSIPADWIEEYDDEGGGIFYLDRPSSGTLRLNVLTFKYRSDCGAADNNLLDIVGGFSKATAGSLRVLENGNVLNKHVRHCTDGGELLQQHYWEIGNNVGASHIRIAVFSYTILASQHADPEALRDIAMLNNELVAAEFAPELGLIANNAQLRN